MSAVKGGGGVGGGGFSSYQNSQRTQETSQWQNFDRNNSLASKSFSSKASPRFESHRAVRRLVDGPKTEDHYRMNGGQRTTIQKESEGRGSQKRLVQSGRFGIFGNYLATRISSLQQSKFLLPSPQSASRIQQSLNNFAHQNFEVYQAEEGAPNKIQSGDMSSRSSYPQFSQDQAAKDQNSHKVSNSKDPNPYWAGHEYGQNKHIANDQVAQSQDYTQMGSHFGGAGDQSPVKKQKVQLQNQLLTESLRESQRHENVSSQPRQDEQILIRQNSTTKNQLGISQQLSLSPAKISQSQRNSAIDPQILRKSELGVAARVASQNIRSVNLSKNSSGLPKEVHMRQISNDFYRTADSGNVQEIEFLQKKQIEALLQSDAGAHQIYLRQSESDNQRQHGGSNQFQNVSQEKLAQADHNQNNGFIAASSLQLKSRDSSRKIAQTCDNGRKNVKILNSHAYQLPAQVMAPNEHQLNTDDAIKEFRPSKGSSHLVDRFKMQQLSSNDQNRDDQQILQGEAKVQPQSQNLQIMIQGSQKVAVESKRQRNSQRKFGSMKHMAHCQSNGNLSNNLASQMKKMDNNSNSQIFKQAGNNFESGDKKDTPIWLEKEENNPSEPTQEYLKKHKKFCGQVRDLKQNCIEQHKDNVNLKKRPILDLTIGPQYCTSLKQRYAGKNFTPQTGQNYKPVLKHQDRHDYNFIVPKEQTAQNIESKPQVQRYLVTSLPQQQTQPTGPDLSELRVQRITAEQALREKQSQMRNIIVRISESANKVLNAQRKSGNHASIVENSRENIYVGYSKRTSNTVGNTPSQQTQKDILANHNQPMDSQEQFHVTIQVKENEKQEEAIQKYKQQTRGVKPLLATKADLSDNVKHNRISIKNLNGDELDKEANFLVGKSQMLKNIQYLEQLAQQLRFKPPNANPENDQKYKELQQNYIREHNSGEVNNQQNMQVQGGGGRHSPELRVVQLPTDISNVQIQTELLPKLPKRKMRLIVGEPRNRTFIQGDDPQVVQEMLEKARQDDYQMQQVNGGEQFQGGVLDQQSKNQRYQYKCPHSLQRKPRPPVFARQKKDNGTCNQQGPNLEKEKGVSAPGVKEETKEAEKDDNAVDQKTEEQKKAEQKEHQDKLMKNFLQKFPPKRLTNGFKSAEEERKKFLEARKDANRKYTEISKDNNKPGKNGPLKFVIYEGNNCSIIRKAMHVRMSQADSDSPLVLGSRQRVRENPQQAMSSGNPLFSADNCNAWEEATGTHLYNFKWKPTSHNFVYDRLSKYGFKQLVNHVEGHQALTTKDQLFLNMKQLAERRQINIYDIIPLTLTVDFQDANYPQRFEQIMQVVGTLEKSSDLGLEEVNKRLMKVQIQNEKVTRSPFLIGPSEHKGKNLWLLKPTGFNRGIGIHVFNSCEDLQNILWNHYRIDTRSWSQMQSIQVQTASAEKEKAEKAEAEKNEKSQTTVVKITDEKGEKKGGEETTKEVKEIKNHGFIVQKYIEEPILFQSRKFDLRIWALISHDSRLYLFKEAYVRTSSQEYDLSDSKMDQVYVHLTNNAVQKYSKNYGKFEEGNIVSMKVLCDELEKQSGQTSHDIKKDINKQMKEQILLSYEAVKPKLNFNNRHTFELLGYDFMVVPGLKPEQKFEVRMIEANTNPCLEEPNQLLKTLLPRMADDMLKIVLDPLFGTGEEIQGGRVKFPVEGYSDSENMFSLIHDKPIA